MFFDIRFKSLSLSAIPVQLTDISSNRPILKLKRAWSWNVSSLVGKIGVLCKEKCDFDQVNFIHEWIYESQHYINTATLKWSHAPVMDGACCLVISAIKLQ